MLYKNELRQSVKERLSLLSVSERKEKNIKLSAHLLDFLLTSSSCSYQTIQEEFILGGYAPLADEAHWDLSLENFKGRTAFPAMGESQMAFFLCSKEALEIRHDFGVPILVPPKNAQLTIPTVLIIPGRAFSLLGERVGRGKGFYDKYLKEFKGLKIGVCFSEQLFDSLPIEVHDQYMDVIITDKEVKEIDRLKR